ncbi:MAG: hypothetical protein ACR2RV_19570 [Verrucomicrobiales bacterium]
MNRQILMILSGALALVVIGGQSYGQAKKGHSRSAGVGLPEAAVRGGFDLDFPGGTLESFVDHVQEASSETLNVVLPEGSGDILIPSLKVRDVQFEEILETLQILMMGPGGELGFQFIKTGSNIWTYHEMTPQARSGQAADDLGEPKSKLCTFALNDLLEVYEISDLVTLITTIWKTGGTSHPENMTVHEETMMLIVNATPEQEAVVTNLLKELTRASETQRALKRDKGTYMKQSEARLQAIQREEEHKVRIMEGELRRSQERLADLEIRHLDELAKLREVNVQLRSEIEALVAKMRSDR